MSDTVQPPLVLLDEEKSILVETIQESTMGISDAQRLRVDDEWEWMAHELRRVVAVNGGAL